MNKNQTRDSSSYDLDKDYSLWWLVLHTRRAMYRAREKELFKHGITPEESAVLFSVHTIGQAVSPAEISRWLLREPHSTSGLLDRMQKKGLIRKVKDLNRKNLIRVAVTEKGQQAYQHSLDRESIHNILSGLSDEEQQQLRSCLMKLRGRALAEIGIETIPSFPKAQQ